MLQPHTRILEIFLSIGRRIPRGGYRLISWMAAHDRTLQSYPVTLKLAPDIRMFVDLRHSVAFPLFKWGCYPHQEVEDIVVPALLRPGDVVVDVGANIGYTALLYSNAVGPQGRVYAFEPDPRALKILRLNASQAGNVEVSNCAVSEKNGVVRFVQEDMMDRSKVVTEDKQGRSCVVQAVTLDDWFPLGSKPVTLLKIDVEGGEPKVLAGAARLLQRDQPIIFFEAFDCEAFSMSVAALSDVLSAYAIFGFSPPNLGGGLVETTQWNPELTRNYLVVPEKHQDRVNKGIVRVISEV